MTRWYMPLSRAWAAASVSDGSLERFQAELPLGRIGPAARLGLAGALRRTADLKARLAEAEAHWNELFFGPRPVAGHLLFNAERMRRRAVVHGFAEQILELPRLVSAQREAGQVVALDVN